jgi:hypothetical protein
MLVLCGLVASGLPLPPNGELDERLTASRVHFPPLAIPCPGAGGIEANVQGG